MTTTVTTVFMYLLMSNGTPYMLLDTMRQCELTANQIKVERQAKYSCVKIEYIKLGEK